MNRIRRILLGTVCMAIAVSLPMPSHSREKLPMSDSSSTHAKSEALTLVRNSAHFRNILQEAGSRLVLVEFYAEWCLPCKTLEPALSDLAQEFEGNLLSYRVNVETHRDLAVEAGVRGLPYVLFIREGKSVHSLLGLQPKDAYRRIIAQYLDRTDRSFQADGSIVGGKRIVKRSTAAPLDSIYVYRGDTVKLMIDGVSFPYSIHIPEFDISKNAVVGRPLAVTFTARELGVFPVYCNGECPTGDGQQLGQIVVMQLAGDDRTQFREISAREAEKLIRSVSPLILDVRTPQEFYQSHIPGAILLPIQQLQDRIREIETYKDKDVLIYCRSGNRSTVAAKLLMGAGFERLHNLRHGIAEWKRENFTVTR